MTEKHLTKRMEAKRKRLFKLLGECKVLTEEIIVKVKESDYKGEKEYFRSLEDKMIRVSSNYDQSIYKSIGDMIDDLLYESSRTTVFVSPWSD